MMSSDKKKSNDHLPIFGKDIIDDWSWDREEEELRESSPILNGQRDQKPEA